MGPIWEIVKIDEDDIKREKTLTYLDMIFILLMVIVMLDFEIELLETSLSRIHLV